jgi:hypothetical protein
MHASAFWRKRHAYAAAREVENFGLPIAAEWTVRRYPEALCQFFNTLLHVTKRVPTFAAGCGRRTLCQPASRKRSFQRLSSRWRGHIAA